MKYLGPEMFEAQMKAKRKVKMKLLYNAPSVSTGTGAGNLIGNGATTEGNKLLTLT